jgi:hypothetical protein
MRQKIYGRGKAILLLLFFLLAFVFQNGSLAVNWNSIEVNNVEYYVQTDKSIYDLGENVEMLYRITNHSENSITYSFGRDPVWNFWVEENGNNVWKAVDAWYYVDTEVSLNPDEYVEFPNLNTPLVWDMIDNSGVTIQSNVYSIIGGLDHPQGIYDYTKVNLQIEVIPEPTSIVLFLTGLPFFQLLRNKKIRNLMV